LSSFLAFFLPLLPSFHYFLLSSLPLPPSFLYSFFQVRKEGRDEGRDEVRVKQGGREDDEEGCEGRKEKMMKEGG